jgi:hypothetical protein
MLIAFSALAVILVAACVCLVVRIKNRHERWAKWTLATVIGLPAVYMLSFGPACWISDRAWVPENVVIPIYRPIVDFCISTESTLLRRGVVWYGELLPTPQPQAGAERWSTVEDMFYAALIRRTQSAEPQ